MTSSKKTLVTLAVVAAVAGAAAPALALTDRHRPAPGDAISELDRHRPAPPQGAVPAAARFDGSHPQ